MMKNVKHVLRLYKVEWVHENGYHAPHSFVEAETKEEAVKLQKQTKARLSAFPESWSWKLSATGLVWYGRRNKWVNESWLAKMLTEGN